MRKKLSIFYTGLFALTVSSVLHSVDKVDYQELDSSTKIVSNKNILENVFLFDHRYGEETEVAKGFRIFENPLGRRFSASGQFSENQFKVILEKLSEKSKDIFSNLHIVDLRQEPHILINGRPVTFYNEHFEKFWGYSSELSLVYEKNLCDQLKTLKSNCITIKKEIAEENFSLRIDDCQEIIEKVETEIEILTSLNIKYQRFSVTDLSAPSPDVCDKYIKFFESLNEKAHLHIHCRAGLGRTSTFMLLYDLFLYKILNQQNPSIPMPSLEALAEEHQKQGSFELLKKQKHNDSYSMENAMKRRCFIQNFYKYLNSTTGYGSQSFSSWLYEKGINIFYDSKL